MTLTDALAQINSWKKKAAHWIQMAKQKQSKSNACSRHP